MKMLCHFVVFLIFVGLVSFVEPKFTILPRSNLKNLEPLYFRFFFFFFRILSILIHTHKGRRENVLKKLTIVYIQKGQTKWSYFQNHANDIYVRMKRR